MFGGSLKCQHKRRRGQLRVRELDVDLKLVTAYQDYGPLCEARYLEFENWLLVTVTGDLDYGRYVVEYGLAI